MGSKSDKWTDYHVNGNSGSSVVDWALGNESMTHKISDFSVGDEVDFSDHVELLIKVSLKHPIPNSTSAFSKGT